MVWNPGTARSNGEGSKNVAAAGTPEKLLAASTPCSEVAVTARPGNTGKIAVGFSAAVRAAAGGEVGAILSPGDTISVPVGNVNQVYIDATVNGEGVSFLFAAPE